jgi:hypothetical protein
MGGMVPQPFAIGGNYSYPEFWVIISDPRYSGYFTLTVAPGPSVEWVARGGHSTVGNIGSHMVLWALQEDSAVRLRGQSLHDLNWESCGGAHRVAPKATSEVKAQAEAKFHMY